MRINTDEYPSRIGLTWTNEGSSLRLTGGALHASDVDAVWWRRPLAPQMPPDVPPEEARWAAGEAQAAIEAFWRTVEAHWVNPPPANALADCKPEQLRRAAAHGFEVPPTLVTNDAAAAETFAREHRAVVCKSLREGIVPVAEERRAFFTEGVDCSDLLALNSLGPEPYLFQEFVHKRYDIRVTVIGEHVFACRIDSLSESVAATDWRKGKLDSLPHSVEMLPDEISDRCLALTHSYGLRFAAIDLARRDDGGFTFFELNPNGQWAWVERVTGIPLRSELVTELTQARV